MGKPYIGLSFEDRKNKYGTYLRTKDPGQLATNLNRLVGAFTLDEKAKIWADSGQTTPFVPVQQAAPKSRWANRFNGWSEPDGAGRRYQVGGQPATVAEVASGYPASPSSPNPAVPLGNLSAAAAQPVPKQPVNPSAWGITPPNTGNTVTGLIGGAVNRSSFKNSDYGYTPEIGTVNSQTDTVQGQLAGLLSKSSPYITRARTSAAQLMNARGGLNSSMAAGAGEAAAIDAGLPIANADAGIFSAQRMANQSATNLARESGSVEANKDYLLQKSGEINSQLENLRAKNISQLSAQEAQQLQTLTAQKGVIDRQLQELVGSQQAGLQTQRLDTQTAWNTTQQEADRALQVLRGEQSTELANIEAANRMLLQTSQSAAQLSATNAAAVQAIMADPNTKPEQKQTAVNQQLSLYRSGLSIIGGVGNADLLGLLDFTPPAPPGTAPAPTPPATVDLRALGGRIL